MFRQIGQRLIRDGAVTHAVSVAELRAQLRLVDGEENDLFLAGLINRATAIVEMYTARVLTPATVECVYAGDGAELTIGICPINEVLSVSDGGATVNFTAPAVGYARRTVVKFDAMRKSDALKVTVKAGYRAGEVPPEMQVLVLTLAADLYEHPQVQEDKAIAENKIFRELLRSVSPIEVR